MRNTTSSSSPSSQELIANLVLRANYFRGASNREGFITEADAQRVLADIEKKIADLLTQ